MASYIIIALCILTLLSYLFDISSKKTKIPGVILLLALGITVRLLSDFFTLDIPNLQPALPILGTVGLILIVLEGSLDLELRQEKIPLIRQTLLSAVVLLLVCSFSFAFAIKYLYGVPFLPSLINAIPLGIISSAIAISGALNLDPHKREFVVYESTFSDIIGILFFNFFVLNAEYGFTTFAGFFLEVGLIIVISAVASFGLGMLLQRITHNVRIIPIIVILVLLYSIAKNVNLPSLVLVMAFGLFLNNIRLLDLHRFRIPALGGLINPRIIAKELIPFKHLVAEVTFVVRSFFFIMFGYYTDLASMLDPHSISLALGIIGFILITRALYFKATKITIEPILFVAPRGLITILLFLSIPATSKIVQINEGLLSQVILISSVVMMIGLINFRDASDSLMETV